MKKLVVGLSVLFVLCGCSTGISGDQSREQSKEWDGDAYEKAMRDAGKGDEYEAEQKKWEASQGSGQGDDQELPQPNN